MAKCKGCGAEIIWAKTVNDKNIPLDVPPEKRFMLEHKQVLAQDQQVVDEITIAHMHDTYMPHHATCPNVENFR